MEVTRNLKQKKSSRGGQFVVCMGEGLFCDLVGAGAPAASWDSFGPLCCRVPCSEASGVQVMSLRMGYVFGLW